jgi:hypothetical protein
VQPWQERRRLNESNPPPHAAIPQPLKPQPVKRKQLTSQG